ncbi:hypothetical protein ACU42Y_21280 [Proteus mirabilis]
MTNITKHKIAIFDLDETLLAGDSSCLWTNYLWEKRKSLILLLALDKQIIAELLRRKAQYKSVLTPTFILF